MSASEDRQTQATRLLALAIATRERGDDQTADELMKLALESMDHHDQMGPEDTPCPPPPSGQSEQPIVAQQQQQIQPKKGEE
jgi:hypothetical protein